MTSDLIVNVIAIIALIINCTVIYLTFPQKYNLAVYAGILALFTVGIYAYDFFTGNFGTSYGGIRGALYLPLFIWLLKGPVFQKTFIVFLQILISMLLAYITEAAMSLLLPQGSDLYHVSVLLVSIAMYTAYVIFMARKGRRFMSRLLAPGRPKEWALYTLGIAFSFVILALIRNAAIAPVIYLLLLLFIAWSFCILCFAIINTHEKSKQKSDAEFARGIVTSGQDHYQKMDGMYEKLRILRHDYKHHLKAVRNMIGSGSFEEANQYLNVVEKGLSEYELQSYCANSVLNALIASFADRCAKLDIRFDVKLDIPEPLSAADYDMCIILGNLLENAVEACEKQQLGRSVELVVRPHGTQLVIVTRNSFNGHITHTDEMPESTKKDGGLGLKSVQAVASRYGGELLTEWNDTTFTAYVYMGL